MSNDEYRNDETADRAPDERGPDGRAPGERAEPSRRADGAEVVDVPGPSEPVGFVEPVERTRTVVPVGPVGPVEPADAERPTPEEPSPADPVSPEPTLVVEPTEATGIEPTRVQPAESAVPPRAGPAPAEPTEPPRAEPAPAEPAAPPAAEPADAERIEPTEPTDALSPSVRRLVKQYDLDITNVRGNGPGGRIRLADVMALIGGREGDASGADAPSPTREPHAASVEPHRAREPEPHAPSFEPQREPEPDMRAPEPVESIETAAGTVTTTVFECDAGRILEDQRRQREQGRELVLSAYFVAAFARALRETRALDSEAGRGIPMLALESARGDGAHALSDADTLSVEQISLALKAPPVASRRSAVLVRHHGLGGSLLIQSTSLGPQYPAMLGIGRIRRQVVVRVIDGDEIFRIASQCLVSLTFRPQRTALPAANALLGRAIELLERWPVLGEHATRAR